MYPLGFPCKMFLTVLMNERSVKGNQNETEAEHIPLFSPMVVCQSAAAQQQDTPTLGEEGVFARQQGGLVFFYSTVPGGRLRLNYSVSCIVVLLLFTVIAHHLNAHSYNQTTRHRNVLFSECTCESSFPPPPSWDAGCTVCRQ